MIRKPRASRSVERLARDPKGETRELVTFFFVSEKKSTVKLNPSYLNVVSFQLQPKRLSLMIARTNAYLAFP